MRQRNRIVDRRWEEVRDCAYCGAVERHAKECSSDPICGHMLDSHASCACCLPERCDATAPADSDASAECVNLARKPGGRAAARPPGSLLEAEPLAQFGLEAVGVFFFGGDGLRTGRIG